MLWKQPLCHSNAVSQATRACSVWLAFSVSSCTEDRPSQATYLLPDGFGRLVYLLPVAHVTDKVVALGAHLPNLLRRLLQAFLSPAPENNLEGENNNTEQVVTKQAIMIP